MNSRLHSALRSLAATVLLGVTAIAQSVVVPNVGIFSGTGTPVSAVRGWTNQLGRFTGTGSVLAQTPTGILGTFAWQSSNGGSLHGTFELTLTTMLAPGVFCFVETATTTGGTGRFVGATGTDTAYGVINLMTSEFHGVFTGQLTLPNGCH